MERTEIPKLDVRYDDDPRVVEEALTEDYALHAVPKTARGGRLSVAMAFYATASTMFYLIAGTTVALAVGTISAIVGIGLAALAQGIINYIISPYAIRTGTTVNLFSRVVFGNFGSALATLLFASSLVFFIVVESSVVGVAFFEYFGGIPLEFWFLIVVLYSIPLAFGGVRIWLDKFNGLLLPFYVIGLVVAVVWTIIEFGYSNDWLMYSPETVEVGAPGWVFAFSIYMGIFILHMYTWDFARFGRAEHSRFHRIVSFGPVFFLAAPWVSSMIGIFLAFSILGEGPVTDLSSVNGLIALMGFLGVTLIWVSQTRINTASYYLGSSNFENFFARVFGLRIRRVIWVVLVGVAAYLFMLIDIFDILLVALQYQGVLIVAWVAIILTHVVWGRMINDDPERSEWRPGRTPPFNWGGIGSWIAAAAVGVGLLLWGETAGATWAPPVSFCIAAGAYAGVLAKRSRRLRNPLTIALERPYDPKTEVGDQWEARIRCAKCDHYYVAIEMDRDPGAGYEPICASCAQSDPDFYNSALQEAKRFGASQKM